MGKQSQTTTRVYGNTTTSNPYATASTNNSGTTSAFAPGSALETIYNTVNKNMDSLLNDYLNPNLNSTTNQAKLNSFVNTLNNTTAANLENNIINPLSNRNMVRSSQATDLYKNLATSNTNATADFVNDLLSSSQENSAKIISKVLAVALITGSMGKINFGILFCHLFCGIHVTPTRCEYNITAIRNTGFDCLLRCFCI